MWDDVVPLLAERYRVVRFDLPGFGKRPGAPFAPGELLANLLDELGIDRAPLVGLSLGGRVALDAALQRPDRVSALVLVAPGVTGLSPAGIYSDEQNREFDEALASGDVERAAEIDLSVWAPLGADERIRELLRDNISGGGDVEVRWTDPPAAERLGDVRVPTLVVVGTRDVPRMLEIADLLVSRIPDARRAELESDHYLPLREPERFAALVAGFLG
jgi:3-oxoadipate enol-lactonase